jgi:hypothetical protein
MGLLQVHAQGTIGIVTRRVGRGPDVIDLVLTSGRPGVPPFAPLPPELRSWGWRAQLHLPWGRPTLAPDPVAVLELTAWSTTETELRLAPVATHLHGWSDRRWNRWFALAHRAADGVVAQLETTPTGLPSHPPVAVRSSW